MPADQDAGQRSQSGEPVKSRGRDVVVHTQPAAFEVDDAGITQFLQVVAERGLRNLEERHEPTDADLSGVPAQDVHELQAYRVAERLDDLGEAHDVLAFDVEIDDGLAAALPLPHSLVGTSALAGRAVGRLDVDREFAWVAGAAHEGVGRL